jgi:hypothetical protein
MSLQVKRCCQESYDSGLYAAYKVNTNNTISIEQDDYSDYDEVLYCMYCGNRLRLEVVPDRAPAEPYKVDLSSLSAKDRALEELKTEMQK